MTMETKPTYLIVNADELNRLTARGARERK